MVTLSQFGNPPANLRDNANRTLAIVAEIFSVFPNRFRFTSGYRTPAQNAAANGVANSYHVQALAADFVPVDGRYPAGEFEAIENLVARYGYELIKHNAGSGLHYHIEPGPSGTSGNFPLPAAVPEVSRGTLLIGFLVLLLLLDD